LRLFQKKKSVFCNICNRELKHKYKPAKEWNIEGFLCADCHIEKTKEFIAKQQQYEEIPDSCIICKKELKTEKKKPRWQWNMDNDIFLCEKCYDQKELAYQTKINFCVQCGKKIGLVRYNPKPKWKIDGQLCRQCWDTINVSQN
jgi:hypothetical protein